MHKLLVLALGQRLLVAIELDDVALRRDVHGDFLGRLFRRPSRAHRRARARQQHKSKHTELVTHHHGSILSLQENQ